LISYEDNQLVNKKRLEDLHKKEINSNIHYMMRSESLITFDIIIEFPLKEYDFQTVSFHNAIFDTGAPHGFITKEILEDPTYLIDINNLMWHDERKNRIDIIIKFLCIPSLNLLLLLLLFLNLKCLITNQLFL